MPWEGSLQVNAPQLPGASVTQLESSGPRLPGGAQLQGNDYTPGTRVGPVGVIALQGDVREHIGALEDLGEQTREVRTPRDLDQVTSLVIPGGESTTMSILLDSSGMLTPLRERLAAGMPAFGTCAGMILLAREISDGRADQHTLGAIDIGVRRNAFGRQVDSFESDLVVDGLGEPFHAVFIRAPVVERVGPGVEVMAWVTDGSGSRRPVLCRDGNIVVAAFHPELSGDPRIHEMFLVRSRAGKGPGAEASAPEA